MNKLLFLMVLLFIVTGCEKFDATNVSCDEKNKCPNDYYCEIDKCVESKCKGEKTDKDNNPCSLDEECNIFTGECGDSIRCSVNGQIKNQVCGFNKKGNGDFKCISGFWIEVNCDDSDECTNGTESTINCGYNNNGDQPMKCTEGQWQNNGECVEVDECTNEDKRNDETKCGLNNAGFQKEICVEGKWTKDECAEEENCNNGCIDDDICYDLTPNIQVDCGLNNRGKQEKDCVEGQWVNVGGCIDPDECVDNSERSEECGFGINNNIDEQLCVLGKWECSVFVKLLGSQQKDLGNDIVIDNEGNIYVTGETSGILGIVNFGEYDMFLAKYSPYGKLLWVKQLGLVTFDSGRRIAIDNNFIYVTGYTSGKIGSVDPYLGSVDNYIAKYDTDGNLIWIRQTGTNDQDYVQNIYAKNGFVYISGDTWGVLPGCSDLNDWDGFFVKYNSNGDFIFAKQFEDGGTTIYVNEENGEDFIYVGGSTAGNLGGFTNSGGIDIFVLKYDSAGNLLKTFQTGTSADDGLTQIKIKSNKLYITGVTKGSFPNYSIKGTYDIFLMKYNTNLEQEFVIQYGSLSDDFAHDLNIDESDNIYITGYTHGALEGFSNLGGRDIILSKFNSLGIMQYSKQWGSLYDDTPFASEYFNGYIHITGETSGVLYENSNEGAGDMFLIKWKPDICVDGERRDDFKRCGYNNNGYQQEICVNNLWIDDTDCDELLNCNNGCIDDDECVNDVLQSIECGFEVINAVNVQICVDGKWFCSDWLKTTGTEQTDIAYGLTVDDEENIYITGLSYGNFDGNTNSDSDCDSNIEGIQVCSDTFLIKYNKFGEVVWSKLIGTSGNDAGRKIVFEDNYIYVIGETSGELVSGNFMGVSDSFIAKYDINGNQIWIKQFGTDNVDAVRDIAIIGNDIYLTGLTYGTFPNNVNIGDSDIFIAKYDINGNNIWIKQSGTNQYDEATSIKIVDIGEDVNIYISGITFGSFENYINQGQGDCFLINIEETGNIKFIKQWGSVLNDKVNSIDVDSQNNIFLMGIKDVPVTTDVFVYKFATDGTNEGTVEIWNQVFTSTSPNPDNSLRPRGDFGYSITTDDSDNIYISGDSWGNYEQTTNNGEADIFLTKLDNSTGTPIYTKQWGSSSLDTGYGVLYKNGYIYIIGETRSSEFYSNISAGGSDAFLIKWSE